MVATLHQLESGRVQQPAVGGWPREVAPDLAYLRTALMLMVAGATAERVMGGSMTIIVTGWAFIFFGVAVGALGTWRFLAMQRKINGRHRPIDLRKLEQ